MVSIPNGQEINYTNKRVQLGEGEASLDVDNRDGFGPETVKLRRVKGTFKYYVHNFSNESPLVLSGAKAVLYKGEQQGTNTGRRWTVYEINATAGTFRTINTLE